VTDPRYRQNLSTAVEIVTALYAEPASTGFAAERIAAIGRERGLQGLADASAGLASLAALAISELSRQRGIPEPELLKRLGLTIQSDDQ
jgi:hypothetical protein